MKPILVFAAITAIVFSDNNHLYAQVLSADFREELSVPTQSPAIRVLAALGEPVDGSPDLSELNEVANPDGYAGSALFDIDPTGLITLTGDHEGGNFANYQLVEFTISNIQFSDNETISGIETLFDNIVDPNGITTGPFSVTTSFSADSISIVYQADTTEAFDFGNGFSSQFQITTNSVPEPSAFLGSFWVIIVASMRRKRGRALGANREFSG